MEKILLNLGASFVPLSVLGTRKECIKERCPDLCPKTQDLDRDLPYILVNVSIFILSLQANQWLKN